MSHRLYRWGIGVIGIVLLLPTALLAATFGSGDSYTVAQPITDNIYASGGTVAIAAPVIGDVFVVGGTVTISAPVTGDVVALGGTVNLLAPVNGDVRVAGGNVLINAAVSGELLAAGGTITIPAGVVIAKQASIAGGQIVLDGTVNNNVKVVGGVLTLNGRINGALSAQLDDSLHLGDHAVIAGGLQYSAPQPAIIPATATIAGEPIYTPVAVEAVPVKTDMAKFLSIWFIIRLLIAAVTAVVVILLLRRVAVEVTHRSSTSFGPSLLLGLGIMIIAPVGALLLALTGVGLGLSVIVFFATILLGLVAKTFAGVLLGTWLHKIISRQKNLPEPIWYSAIAGAMVLALLLLVPIIGWVVHWLLCLVSVGAASQVLWRRLRA